MDALRFMNQAVFLLLFLHVLFTQEVTATQVVTAQPTVIPTRVPTRVPTTMAPTRVPTIAPTTPTYSPTKRPTLSPTMFPTTLPTLRPITGIYSEYTLMTSVFIPNTTVKAINTTDSRYTLTRTMKYLLDSYKSTKIPAMSITLDLEDSSGARRSLTTSAGTNVYYSLYYTLENTNCTDEADLLKTVNSVLTRSGSSSSCNNYCFITVLHMYDDLTDDEKFQYVEYVNVSDTYIEVQSVIISDLPSDSISFIDAHKEVLLMFGVALVYIFVFIVGGVRIALHKKSKLSIKSNEGMLTAIENPVGRTLAGLMKGKSGNKAAAPLFVSRKDIEKPQVDGDANSTETGLQMQKGNLLNNKESIGGAAPPLATQMPRTVTLPRGPLGGAAPLASQMPRTVTLPRPGVGTPPRPPLPVNASPGGLPPPPPPAVQNARPPPPRPPVAANTPPPPPLGAGGSDKFSAFKKLLNMNVPEMAVRNKMLMKGISQAEIDEFFKNQ